MVEKSLKIEYNKVGKNLMGGGYYVKKKSRKSVIRLAGK